MYRNIHGRELLTTHDDAVTDSVQYTAVSVLHRRLSVWRMLLHWFITFWGNLAGSLFMVSIIFGCKRVFPLFIPGHNH